MITQSETIVQYWADNHLVYIDNQYQLLDNQSQQPLFF